ncbi:MAG: DUF4382 domain-containing protein [Bacteroidota bacterium]
MWGKIKRLSVAAMLMAGLFAAACSDDDETKNATIQVRLTDAQGDYQEVNIDIQDVQINQSSGNSGWESIDLKAKGVYNLLDLTNGLDTLLGTYELPPGTISQIRLVLGTNNSIKVGSNTYDLFTPSAQQSGLKLNFQTTLKEGITYKILLDFDAGKSIVARGNNTYLLKPVIRAISEATTGAIKGSVTPLESNPAIYALNGTDTVASTFPDVDGKFLIRALPAATYHVKFAPKTGYLPKEIIDVDVTTGTIKDLGAVTIEQ